MKMTQGDMSVAYSKCISSHLNELKDNVASRLGCS